MKKKIVKDTEGNIFAVEEILNGFRLRGNRGIKEIGQSELRFYKKVL